MQTGVHNAGTHFWSAPQAMTFESGVEQVRPGAHGAGAAIFLCFFASEGATETAIAITATAPTNKSFVIDFMRTPSVNDVQELHGICALTRSISPPTVDSHTRLH